MKWTRTFKIIVASTMISSLLGILLLPGIAKADVNDFTITNFVADYYLSDNDPQGAMEVKEQIDVVFTDQNHGILRALPKKYKNQNLRTSISSVSRADGTKWPFTTYTENDNLVAKIGDPDKTVTGQQSFTIKYKMQNVITFYGDHDELYWDVNGDQWAQPFQKVQAKFHLPSGVTANRVVCYTGTYGSSQQDCVISKGEDGTVIATTVSPLLAGQTLTAVTELPRGHFRPATKADWLKENMSAIVAVVLPVLLTTSLAYRHWRLHGRDLKGRGTIVPKYSPPAGLTPAEVGVVNTYKLSPTDVSATIIDLAIHKYIRILEVTKKKILKDKKTYQLELLKTEFAHLKPHEQKILQDIFPLSNSDAAAKGTIVNVEDLKDKFYKTLKSLQSSMPMDMVGAEYFASNPLSAGSKLYGLGVAMLVVGFLLHSWISLGLAVSAAILFVFGALMPRRTAKGVAAHEGIQGLKLYMQVAEADRLKMLHSPDAPYSAKSHEPVKSVELFEKLLPYAIVLGVEQDWAKKFENIYRSPPDWYVGNWATFNAVYFASSIGKSVSAMSTSFSPPSSSSGSGFGGGGFSGGGGGGGGGGGW